MEELSRRLRLEGNDIDEFLDKLNYKFKEFCLSSEKCSIWSVLSYIGEERGGKDMCGSMIWADFFEHVDKRNYLLDSDIIQIVGHTQLNYHPASIDTGLYCLDCREPFYIDRDGIIRSCIFASLAEFTNFVKCDHSIA